MKILIIPFVLGLLLHDTTAVTHSLKYIYIASSGVPDFPEFVTVGLVDDAQIDYYDSNTEKDIPKQDWMSRVTEERANYWQVETENRKGAQQVFKANIGTLKQRFNQTGGAHIVQMMYGCEWDDETKSFSDGFMQFGYDGEDFLSLDLNTKTWTAPVQQAVLTKQRWDKVQNERAKQYLTTECTDWLQKYLNYGSSSLLRTDLPSVSLLQKTPSSPVTCHASGFYPNSAMMFWRKDGEELQEDVEVGEIIPNHDGSFQMSVDLLKLPSDDWGRYECVFQLAGVKEDQVTKLKDRIRTNYENPIYMILLIVAGVILLSTVVCVAGFFIHKNRKAKRPPSPPPANTTAVEEEVMLPESLNTNTQP